MRDGRRQRLGLATGTANPNDEDVSTSGLGSLISTSDLFSKVLTDQNATTGNQAYLDRILDEQGPDTLNLDPGAYVDTRDNRYINDAYNYYLGGGTGDFADEVAIDTPAATTDLGEITADGGAGQAMSGLDAGNNLGFDSDVTPGPSGFIGLDPDMDIDPRDINDYGTYDPPELGGADGMSGGQATPGAEFADQNPYGGDGINDLGADNFDTFEEVEPQSQLASEMIAERNAANRTDGLEDYLDGFDTVPEADNSIPDEYDQEINNVDFSPLNIGEISGPATMTVDELAASSADQGLDAFDPSAVSQAFTAGKQAIAEGISTVAEVGQSIANTIGGIYNGEDQTISILGKEINVPTTLGGIALGQALNFPVTLAFGALRAIGGMLPDGIEYTTDKARETGLLQGDNTVTQDIYGINTQSMFGDYNQYNIDRVEQLEDKVNKTPKDITELQQRKDYIESSGADGNIAPAATPTDIATGNITGDASVAESVYANEEPIGDQGSSVNTNTGDITDSTGNYAGNIMDEFAPAPTPAPAPAPAPAPTYGPYSGGGGRDSGGDGGGQQQSSGGGYNEGNFCFDPSTPIQMADGSTKEIKNIQLGDDTKGGEVTGVFQFKASDDIHNYRGVTVAGGHYVKENNKFIMVQDSPLAVKIDKIPVVYSLDTTGRRIFIKDIEFADYNGDGVAKNFLSNAGVTLEGFDKEVLRQVEQRLI